MKKFIIERDVPGAGNMTAEELHAIAKISISSMSVLGKPYVWVESFVTANKIFCVHEAEDEEAIRQHSSCAKFPVNGIAEVKVIINPATAD